MAGYKIDKRSLKDYFELQRDAITAIEKWQHKTDEIVYGVQAIAPDIPFQVIRKAFLKVRKTWLVINDEDFARVFVVEESPKKVAR